MEEQNLSDWSHFKTFVNAHWKVLIIFLIGVVVAIIGGIFVFYWILNTNWVGGYGSWDLGMFSIGNFFGLFFLILLLELLIVGVPLCAYGGIVFYLWWTRLTEEEKAILKRENKKPKKKTSKGASGVFSFLLLITFLILVFTQGNWNTPINTLPYLYWLNNIFYAVFWVLIVIGIPALIIILYFLLKKYYFMITILIYVLQVFPLLFQNRRVFLTIKCLFNHFGKKEDVCSVESSINRTLFFDFGTIIFQNQKWILKIHIYSTTGQDFYNVTRPITLQAIDGIIFVVDSQMKVFNRNLISWKELNSYFYEDAMKNLPILIAFNKQDLPNKFSHVTFLKKVNYDYFKNITWKFTIALNGEGILGSFEELLGLIFKNLYKIGLPVEAN
ncbi:MAG: ADP-ribosylation factor-like protein [Candidatus Lokiarchaeota archaeon]